MFLILLFVSHCIPFILKFLIKFLYKIIGNLPSLLQQRVSLCFIFHPIFNILSMLSKHKFITHYCFKWKLLLGVHFSDWWCPARKYFNLREDSSFLPIFIKWEAWLGYVIPLFRFKVMRYWYKCTNNDW
jgi:hypothetical protein